MAAIIYPRLNINKHRLSACKITPNGFSLEKEDGEYNPTFDKRFHASGHASRADITWVIDQIDPDHIVPIHTEAREWFSESFDNVVLPLEGDKWEF